MLMPVVRQSIYAPSLSIHKVQLTFAITVYCDNYFHLRSMGEIRIPHNVSLIVSILYSREEMLQQAMNLLNDRFFGGELLSFSQLFDFSDYYNEELGTPIYRRFWRADRLFPRDSLADVKSQTNEMERQYIREGKRQFNLDPGFLSAENFILATTKNYTHRIYLRDGIYADLTLVYKEKGFRTLEWTYPDYAGEEIRNLLRMERERYLGLLRE